MVPLKLMSPRTKFRSEICPPRTTFTWENCPLFSEKCPPFLAVIRSILSILVKNLKGLRTDSLKSLIERSICALFRYLAIQNFHPIYSYVAIGNMSTANTNSTQFKLRYIQAHISSTILS